MAIVLSCGGGGRRRGFCGCWNRWCTVRSASRFWFDSIEASLAASRILFAGRNVGVAVLVPFFFLDEVNIGYHDSLLVRVIFVCFCAKPILVRLLVYLPLALRIDAASTAFGNCSSPRSGICDDVSNIYASPYRSTS